MTWNDGNKAHITHHKVTPEEVEEVIFEGRLVVRRGRGEGVYYAYGQTKAGRYLFIVFAILAHGQGLVVTARDMEQVERRLYQRKQDRR